MMEDYLDNDLDITKITNIKASFNDNNDIEMKEYLEDKPYNKPEDDYYSYMLQKVMTSIPDVNINKKKNKSESSSDGGDSINEYSNQTIFNYFNSFD
jgi:hypothetical protein